MSDDLWESVERMTARGDLPVSGRALLDLHRRLQALEGSLEPDESAARRPSPEQEET